MPSVAPHLLARFQKMPQHQRREERRRRERERRRHQEQDVRRLLRRHRRRDQRHHQQQDLGDRHAARRRRVRVDHLVVEVVRQRVGDRQQQAVGGGQRRRQAAGRHQARDHVRQARDLRRGQHDDVAADRDLGELHDAVLVDVDDRQQRRIDLLPRGHPLRQLRELGADHERVDVVLHQHRQRRRREVQQEDEEQRPEHRLARLPAPTASCSSASGCAAARRCRPSGRTPAPGSCGATRRAPRRPCPGTPRRGAAAARRAPRARRPSSSAFAAVGVLRIRGERLLGRRDLLGAARCRPSASSTSAASFALPASSAAGRSLSLAPASSARALKMPRTSSSFGSLISFSSRAVTFSSCLP